MLDCQRVNQPRDLLREVVRSTLQAYERFARIRGLAESFVRALGEKVGSALQRIEELGAKVGKISRVYIQLREAEVDPHELISSSFEFLEGFAREKGLTLVVLLDEAQKLRTLGSEVFDLLKSEMDQVQEVRYIFSGSSLSLLQQVFLEPNAPLYLRTKRILLKPLGEDVAGKYLAERLRFAGKKISKDALDRILELTRGMPFYVQWLGHTCYWHSVVAEQEEIGLAMVNQAYADALEEFGLEFEARFESGFSPNQRSILRAMADEGGGWVRLFQIGWRMHKPLNLLGKDMRIMVGSMTLERGGKGEYRIVDPLYEGWLSATPLP
jgi:hypothetical protein